jgi:glycerol uptake facilitator protein
MSAQERLLVTRNGASKTPSDVLYLALGQGLALFVILLVVGKVSGALINPAVTLALASARRFKVSQLAPYLLAQFSGAILGAALIPLLLGASAGTIGRVGALTPAPGVSLLQAAAVEAAGTFLLLLAITAVAEDPRAPSGWAPLAIGMALAVSVVLFEPLTGAGVNPARAFGPDLIYALFFAGNVNWLTYLVAYLAGPVIGGTAAVWLYCYVAQVPLSKPLPE